MELPALVRTLNSLQTPVALAALRRMMPPRSVVHVGAGNGVSAARLWGAGAVEHLWLFDANPDETEQLTVLASKVAGWDASCVLLADHDSEDGVYYVSSNPSANGRVCADELRALWPNLRSIQTCRMPERRLDGMLDARGAHAFPAPNWIYVDCFPAIPILKGAGRYLDDLDVVWARVVLDEQLSVPAGCSLRELTAFLGPKGFLQVDVTEGLHPAIGDVVFVRDWRLRSQARIQELQSQVLARSRLYDDQVTAAADWQTKFETLLRERDAQAQAATEQAAKVAEIAQARDAQAELAAERQVQLEQAAQAKDAQEKRAKECSAEVHQLEQDAESLRQATVELREELRQARQTANLATKLHMLREADLEELQSRYREATDVQERQHQLMLQLEGKLRIAAQYFHQLQSTTVTPAAIAAAAAPTAKPPRRRTQNRKKTDVTAKE